MKSLPIVFVWVALALSPSQAGIVINEVFYDAPSDLDDVQWIELFNKSDAPADIGGWTIDKGELFTFPAGASVAAKGFLIISLNPERFSKFYDKPSIGPFKRSLNARGERIELRDGDGKLVDSALYKNSAPWPLAADGASASLERICPDASGDLAENWAASPLPDKPRPAGTPGGANAAFSPSLPPVISPIKEQAVVKPKQPLNVTAYVKSDEKIREVVLLYRTRTAAGESPETPAPMAKINAGRYVASIPGQAADTLIRYRVRATSRSGAQRVHPAENELRPTLSIYVHDQWEPAPISLSMLILNGADGAGAARQDRRGGPFGGFPFFRRPAEGASRPPRGASTFIHVDTRTGVVQLFDYVNISSRQGHPGHIVHFQKDRPFKRQTAVSVVFEGDERPLLMESLAYDVYRRAGQPAPASEFTRVWVNGELIGYHLLVERPNKGFLRRNKIDDKGNLYKVIWQAQGLVGTHVKETNTRTDHEDLKAVVGELGRTKGSPDDQWAVIEKHFDVDQVASYFAINIVLSHWDGFFNNHYSYHDPRRDKWMMFPWDQDRTWGDGMFGDQPLVDLPLNFGMEGARPPGRNGGGGGGGFFGGFGGGPIWWRPPGVFSGPLLANPRFRKVFLAKIRDILRTNFTEENYLAVIDDLAVRLGDDAALRARLRGEDEAAGREQLARNIAFLKAFLQGRREYLLKQDELTRVEADANADR